MEETMRFSAPVRGLAVASAGLGFFNMCVYWWFPFGMCLGVASIILGTISVVLGIRASTLGEHVGLIGLAFGMAGLGTGLTLYRVFHLLMTDYTTPPQF
jgi:hypothetical protein